MQIRMPYFPLALLALTLLTWSTADAGQTPIEGMDIHDCAEGADEDLKTPVTEPKPATS